MGLLPVPSFIKVSQLVAVTLAKVLKINNIRLNGLVMNACSKFETLHDSQTSVADGGELNTSKQSSSYMYHLI
jgi:hypothetical protein